MNWILVIYLIFYGEIVATLGKKTKTIIIIEDLDRINEKILLSKFLKEIYRFNNLSKPYFVFLLAIKPETQLQETEDNKPKIDYSKLFDFIIELKPLHIEDYSSVLISLLEDQKEKIKHLTGIDIDGSLPPSFSWLIKGKTII